VALYRHPFFITQFTDPARIVADASYLPKLFRAHNRTDVGSEEVSQFFASAG
jgi:hypothetical protein